MKKFLTFTFFTLLLLFLGCESKQEKEKKIVQARETINARVQEKEERSSKAKAKEQERIYNETKKAELVELYKKILAIITEKYLGYYIYPIDLHNIKIIGLSFNNDCLVLQEYFIVDNDIQLGNSFLLDSLGDWSKDEDDFSISNSKNPYISVLYYSYSATDNIEIWYDDGSHDDVKINSNINIFVKNKEDIIKAMRFFTYEGQKEYAGKFVFHNFEIKKSRGFEVPKNETKEINVTIDKDGYLYAEHMNEEKFFIKGDKINQISSFAGDGGFTSFGGEYYYLDADTICYEYFYWTYVSDDGLPHPDEDAPLKDIEYKITYKKVK